MGLKTLRYYKHKWYLDLLVPRKKSCYCFVYMTNRGLKITGTLNKMRLLVVLYKYSSGFLLLVIRVFWELVFVFN